MTSPTDEPRAETPPPEEARPRGERFLTHLPRPPEERSEMRLADCTDEAHLLRAYLDTLQAALIYEEDEGGGGSHSWFAQHVWFMLSNLEAELDAVRAAVSAGATAGGPEAGTEEHTGVAGSGTEDAGSAPAEGRN